MEEKIDLTRDDGGLVESLEPSVKLVGLYEHKKARKRHLKELPGKHSIRPNSASSRKIDRTSTNKGSD